jgi:3-dehydrosphinganine reductase
MIHRQIDNSINNWKFGLILGLTGLFGYTAYSASKFALRGFAEALQMEVKPFNISVTIAFAPDTDTPCLAEENKMKPIETKLISDTAGISQPDKVAQAIFEDTLVRTSISIILSLE